MPPGTLYFAGKADAPVWMAWDEFIKTDQAFLHYVATVWVNEHPVPVTTVALASFCIDLLRPDYEAFLLAGKRMPHRGLTLEEQWLCTQLALGKPVDLHLNRAQPRQLLTRVTRLRRSSPRTIWAFLRTLYADPSIERPWPSHSVGYRPLQLAVYDGDAVAHFVTPRTLWEERLHFFDPWPSDSLLCTDENGAGVAAQPSDLLRNCWSITEAEFGRVAFGLYIDALAPGFGRGIPMSLEERTEAHTAYVRERARTLAYRTAYPSGSRPPDVKPITRLTLAAALGRMWEVKVSLNEGDDVNAIGEMGTALHAAARNGHAEIVRLLLRQGADPRLRDPDGRTAAECAVAHGDIALGRSLRTTARIWPLMVPTRVAMEYWRKAKTFLQEVLRPSARI